MHPSPIRRPLRTLMPAILAALVVTACTTTAAGWTYAPVPPATPAPSVEPSAAPAAPSVEPSAGASAQPSAGPTAGGSPAPGQTVTIVAQGVQFTTADVTAPAGTAFTLAFDNEDAAIPHDVVIRDGSGSEVFKTDIFPGVETRTYDGVTLPAGSYTFVCTVHATMTGTLEAQ